ncbi:hypothetical protein DB44_CW00930 [Candidatus Protochlamydia amoebophila]|uniref:Uncharacterized protein n=2 Tax=Candidatus Protochlamydia amoebophila TaxID=362787 RepID=A0A0C1JKV4_9BACT|nr:hypothetical protein DB44_CW00930 [Candidatus Protochlamydia amoebophila]
MPSYRVIGDLDRLSLIKRMPESIRVDNDPEYTSKMGQRKRLELNCIPEANKEWLH